MMQQPEAPTPLEERCQSCGLLLGNGFYSVEESGSWNKDYCRFCYKFGKFLEPDLTAADMINRSVSHMRRVLGKEEIEARQLAESLIPKLKRWQSI